MGRFVYKGYGKTVSDTHVVLQYAKFLNTIETTFESPRIETLLDMYSFLSERIQTAPASSKVFYHNCYPGGYLDHVLGVIKNVELVTRLYTMVGGDPRCTKEERIFAAMHHDLGKLGDDSGPFYIPEDADFWNKKGSMYKHNDDLRTMNSTDRAFYLLQMFDVKMTANEMTGIRAADGLYDEKNKEIFMPYGEFPNDTNIHLLVHWADCMAANSEKDEMRATFVIE